MKKIKNKKYSFFKGIIFLFLFSFFIILSKNVISKVYDGFSQEALVNSVVLKDAITGHEVGDSSSVSMKIPENNIDIKTRVDNPHPEISEIIEVTIEISNLSNVIGIPNLEVQAVFNSDIFEIVDRSLKISQQGSNSDAYPFTCNNDATKVSCSTIDFAPSLNPKVVTFKLKPLIKADTSILVKAFDSNNNEIKQDIFVKIDDPENFYVITRTANKTSIDVGEEVIITTNFHNRHPNKILEDVWFFDNYDSEKLELKSVKYEGRTVDGKKVYADCQQDGVEIRCHLENMQPWESREITATFLAISTGTAKNIAKVYDEDSTEKNIVNSEENTYRISANEDDENSEDSTNTNTDSTDNQDNNSDTESETNTENIEEVTPEEIETTQEEDGLENISLAKQDITIIIKEPGQPIVITKDINKGAFGIGENVQVVTTITNRTKYPIQDFRITDEFEGDILEIVSVIPRSGLTCSNDSTKISCNINELRAGTKYTFVSNYKTINYGVVQITTKVLNQETFKDEQKTEDLITNIVVKKAGNPFVIRKTPNKDTLEIGESIDYTITIKNSSENETIKNIRLFDDYPEKFLEFEKLTIQNPGEGLNCSPDASSMVCDIDSLSPGKVFVVVTKFKAIASGRAINTVVVSDDNGLKITSSDDFTSGVSVSVDSEKHIGAADSHVIIKNSNNPLQVTKRVDRVEVSNGETVKFLIKVQNQSLRNDIKDITLKDTYDIETLRVNPQSIPGNCSVSAGLIFCEIGDLAPQENYQFIPEFTAINDAVINRTDSENPDEEGIENEDVKTVIAINRVEVTNLDFIKTINSEDESSSDDPTSESTEDDDITNIEYYDISEARVIIKAENNPFQITKTVDNTQVNPGDKVNFTIMLQNMDKNGRTFEDIMLSDIYPAEYLKINEDSVPNCEVSAGRINCFVGSLTERGYGVFPATGSYFKLTPEFTVLRPLNSEEGPITVSNIVLADDGVYGHKDVSNAKIIINDPGNPMVLQKNPNNGVVEIGETVQYVAFLRNRSLEPLQNIKILDDFEEEFLELQDLKTIITNDDEEILSGGHSCKSDVSNIFCDIDSLAYDQTFTIIADFRAIKAGRPKNTITAEDKNGNKAEQTAEVIIPKIGLPFILTKFPHDGTELKKPKTTVNIGDEVFFTITLRSNAEAETLENIFLTDEFSSENLEFIDIFSDGGIFCSPDSQKINCNISELKPKESVSFTTVFRAIKAGSVQNKVVATTKNSCEDCEDGSCCEVAVESNIVIPEGITPFSISKSPNNGTISVGEMVSFTVKFKNRDEFNTVKNIEFIDDFQEEFLEMQSVETKPLTNNCTADADKIRCSLDQLEPNEEFMIISKFKALKSGTTTNNAKIFSNSSGIDSEEFLTSVDSSVIIKDPDNPLFISHSTERTNIQSGDRVKVTVSIQNRHEYEIFENVVLTHEYDAELLKLDESSVPENCFVSAGLITCDIDKLYTIANQIEKRELANIFTITPYFTAIKNYVVDTEEKDLSEEEVKEDYFDPVSTPLLAKVSDGQGGHENQSEIKIIINDPRVTNSDGSMTTGNTNELYLIQATDVQNLQIGQKVIVSLNLKNLSPERIFYNLQSFTQYETDLLELVTETLPKGCSADAGKIHCDIGTLYPTIDEVEYSGGEINNYNINFEFKSLEKDDEAHTTRIYSQINDGDGGHRSNKETSVLIIKKQNNPFELTKTTNKTVVEVGEMVSFKITLRNKDSYRNFKNITLIDTFPPEKLQIIPESLPDFCNVSVGTITCKINNLSPIQTDSCNEGIFSAIDPITNTCHDYSNSCDVPENWQLKPEGTCGDYSNTYLFRDRFVVKPEFLAVSQNVIDNTNDNEEENNSNNIFGSNNNDELADETKNNIAIETVENKVEAFDDDNHKDFATVKIFVKENTGPFLLSKGVRGGSANFEIGEKVVFDIVLTNNYQYKIIDSVQITDNYPGEFLKLNLLSIPDYCVADASSIVCNVEKIEAKNSSNNKVIISPEFTVLENTVIDDSSNSYNLLSENESNSSIIFNSTNDDSGNDDTNINSSKVIKNSVSAVSNDGNINAASATIFIKNPTNPLYLTKSLTETTTVEVGEEISYNITLQNLSHSREFKNLILVDNFPTESLKLISDSIEKQNCTFGAGKIECKIEKLDPDGSFMITPRFIALSNSNNNDSSSGISFSGYSNNDINDGIEEYSAGGLVKNTATVEESVFGYKDTYEINLRIIEPLVQEIILKSNCEDKSIFIGHECQLIVEANYKYMDSKILKSVDYFGFEELGDIDENVFTAKKTGEIKIKSRYQDIESNEITIKIVDSMVMAISDDNEIINYFPARVTKDKTDEFSSVKHFNGQIDIKGEDFDINKELVAENNRLIFSAKGGSGHYSWFIEDKSFGRILDFEESLEYNIFNYCFKDKDGSIFCRNPETGDTTKVDSNCYEKEIGIFCDNTNKIIFESNDKLGEVEITLYDDDKRLQKFKVVVLPSKTKSLQILDEKNIPLKNLIEVNQQEKFIFKLNEYFEDGSLLKNRENSVTWEFSYNNSDFTQEEDSIATISNGVFKPFATGTFTIRAKKYQYLASPGVKNLMSEEVEIISDEITILVGDPVPYIDSIRTSGNLGMAKGTSETLFVRLQHFGGLDDVSDIELSLIKGAHSDPKNIPESVQNFSISIVENEIMQERLGTKTVLLKIPFFVPLLQDIEDGLHTFKIVVRNANGEGEPQMTTGLLTVFVGDPKKGDANWDGDLGLEDAVLSLRFIKGTQEPNYPEKLSLQNNDNDNLTLGDFVMVFKSFVLQFIK